MPNYSVQISLATDSGLDKDRVVNTWSCEAADDAAASDFGVAVRDVYQGLTSYLSNDIAQNGHLIKIYDRSDLPPRQPVEETTWNLTTGPSAAALPNEVALCLSFQGTPESGVSQARKRGRVFIGPLGQNTIASTGRPASAFVTDLVAEGAQLLAASTADPDWTWTVYSSTTGDSSPVVDGWVDDEYDTQRRRGREATSRTTF